jgi:hypothetical protein
MAVEAISARGLVPPAFDPVGTVICCAERHGGVVLASSPLVCDSPITIPESTLARRLKRAPGPRLVATILPFVRRGGGTRPQVSGQTGLAGHHRLDAHP